MAAVTPAIPASQIVNVIPSVLAAGGNALDLNGLLLTQSTRPPIGQVLQFPDKDSVGEYFGDSSQEAALAAVYFLGPNKKTAIAGAMLVAQYPAVAVGAYLRGGDASGLSLTQLKALTGTLSVTIDGVVKSGTVNLNAATSFSSAAQIIADALDIAGATAAQVTGSIAGTTLTVSAVSSGTLAPAQLLSGTGVTAGTFISSQLTGTTGGTGTYLVSPSQTALSQAITALAPDVSYDSTSGGFVVSSASTGTASTIGYATGTLAAGLFLTQATGAVTSQGAAATDPNSFLTALTRITQNWATFWTTWEPVAADKDAFALWTDETGDRYAYLMWETDVLDTESGGPSPTANYIANGNLSGTAIMYENPAVDTIGGEFAAFAAGWAASLDFGRTNGRSTFAFQSQSGLQAQVTDALVSSQLQAFGINFYGDFTTANEAFIWAYPGTVSGPFKWLNSYVQQIWLNSQLQLALMVLLDNVGSIPYNAAGRALIEAALLDPIGAALNFGAIRAGVTLSNAQIAEVNAAAGAEVATVLSQRGWYLQVKDASPQVRAARGSPPVTLWYADGGDVQKITLASIEVQ